jgi:hypothetical protein
MKGEQDLKKIEVYVKNTAKMAAAGLKQGIQSNGMNIPGPSF